MREIKRVTRKNERVTAKRPYTKSRLANLAAKKELSTSLRARKSTPKSEFKRSEVIKKQTTKKTSPTKSKVIGQNKSSEGEVIILPDTVSKTARMRERLLRMELNQHLEQAMYKIAYGIGLCFILVGAAYALLPQYTDILRVLPQSAAVLETTEATDPVLQETVKIAPSEFTFLSLPPANVTTPFEVTFMVTNSSNIAAHLIHSGVVDIIRLPVEKVSSDKYKVILDPKNYYSNYYRLRITVEPGDGSPLYVRTTDEFFTADEKTEATFNEQFSQETTTVTENESTVTQSDTTIKITETEPIVKIIEPELVFSLKPHHSLIVSDSVVLQMQAPDDALSIELYARQTNSLSERYVAAASKRQGQWVFTFDSKNLPNGSYVFFARSLYKDRRLVTNSVSLTVQNNFTTQTVEPIVRIQPRDTSVETEPRFVESIKTVEPQIEYVQQNEAEMRAQNILYVNATEFDSLLKNYATAVQTGDESLIRLAQEALIRRQDGIQLDLIADQASREIADKVAIELESQIHDLKQRIDAFEALRRERTAGESALDSDSDGISDYDEIHLYGTDPFSADTDGDGIPDGAEIMMGLDPLVPDAESIIQYESPKSLIGLVRPDVLFVDGVLPVLQAELDASTALVSTEIKGRGLPNSFVTLFIFSSPTVVTVRTDADGMFVYTYEKELEDGRHDVYVAVTDNVGRIIAHSNPFSFVKEAQAFTPVDASESGVITSSSLVDSTNRNAYSSTLGIAVLALGVILLMLGISLRKKEGVVSTGNTDEPEALDPVLEAKIKYKSDRREHIDAT